MSNEERSGKESNGSAGFQPVSFLQTTYRRLPHWQQGGSVYFVSWVCRTGQTLEPADQSITLEAIRFWDARKWTIYAAVVMPDHVHLLAQPLTEPDGRHINLAEIIHSVKSFSAQKINRSRGVRGSFWQVERYDRIVRDEAEFLEKWQYIRNNPVKAGFVEQPEDYPWLYEKQE